MSSLTPIGRFRAQMELLLNKLTSWASPEQQKELEKFRLKYDMGMRADPRGTLNYFIDGVKPYATHIMEGNDTFFLREDMVYEENQPLSRQLQAWWPKLDERKKTYIKDQFKALLMLGAIATRDEELREIINMFRDPANPLTF